MLLLFWVTLAFFLRDALVSSCVCTQIAKFRKAFCVRIAVVAKQFIAFTNDSFSTETRATTPLLELSEGLLAWVVHPGALDLRTHAILVAITLCVALKDVAACPINTAA